MSKLEAGHVFESAMEAPPGAGMEMQAGTCNDPGFS